MELSTITGAMLFGAVLSFSVNFANAQSQPQTVTDTKKGADITASTEPDADRAPKYAEVGKEIPVAGAVLFVTPAQRTTLEKARTTKEAMSAKDRRRNKKAKKSDRKEVTRVIGNSMSTYLANVYDVHTLQRF